MRILLKFVIDCDPDAAWRALHSPRAVAELYGPLLEMAPLDVDGLPTSFGPGAEVPVQLSLAGIVPMGQQLIHVTDRLTEDARGPVRIFRDSGMPLTGPLSSLDVWDHQMAIAPAPGDPTKTLWRDRLVIQGPTAFALWPVMWAMWQWRAARVKALAPTWAHDPETETAEPATEITDAEAASRATDTAEPATETRDPATETRDPDTQTTQTAGPETDSIGAAVGSPEGDFAHIKPAESTQSEPEPESESEPESEPEPLDSNADQGTADAPE